MQQEQQVRGGVPVEGLLADRGVARPSADPAAGVGGAGTAYDASALAESVPSDQLWRAAIRAAREAAALAAELRRQLAAGADPDDGPRAVA